MKLAGKVAIITGAASGMGYEEAKMFAAEGAKVVITDINADACRKAAEEIGDAVVAVQQDVADEASWKTVVDTALSRFGKIDILVNNAGLTKNDTFDNTDAAFMRRMLDVNIVGSFLGMKAVREPMTKNGGGVIINIASGLAFTSLPGYFAYGISKWGVRGMTRLGAKELAPDNIRVVTVTPGAIETPSLVPAVRENAKALIPLGRVGGSDEFARVVVFVASDDASYLAGAEIMVDGAMIC
jgi:3alpha(or 20beta)-hydroxysteroid dehydrogenase